jgi:two-component system sensor histidine kinase/response regulator
MLNFGRSSLNKKLTIISFLSTGTALLLVFAACAVTSVRDHRQHQGTQLASFAAVIGANSVDALMGKNRSQAFKTLSALKVKHEISTAVLFDRKGKLFAHYVAPDRTHEPAAVTPMSLDEDALAEANRQGSLFWSSRMRLYRPITDNELQVGIVMLEADLSAMWFAIFMSLAQVGAATGGALLLALLLASRCKRTIAEPVATLISTAQQVSASQDYSLRIAHRRTDELGTLIDSFNAILAQIEGRGAALTHHRDELERQVSVRTEQLEKAKNAAEAASYAKSAFLATMSHEIRTPMNGVLGMTEMLLGTALTETQRKFTRLLKRSGEHLMVIINDILDFSKIEAGKLSVEYIDFNLWDLLGDMHNIYTPQADAKAIALEFDIANDIPIAVCGDPNRLRQIMANLLGNAIKFTERGRILAKVQVVGEDAQEVAVRFEVHDTGIGVSRDASGRIFEAFSQADNSTTRKYGGTGLGLAISKQLVELMGGEIGVRNALTQGSIFWFTVSFDKPRVDPDEPGALLNTMEGLRVLIVDEHPGSRQQLERQLACWQVASDSVASAVDAFETLMTAARAGKPYTVAILDMDLRRTSGLALAASIKAEPAIRATRVLLLSSDRLAADPVQRREAGVAYQLIKPAREGDLFECIVARPRRRAGPAEVAAPEPAALPAVNGHRSRKVLLAEDNPVNVEVATAMLDGLGLEVHCVGNGEQALQAARAGGYDVVLMDCQMPVMDGFAATAEIRRHEQQGGRPRTLPIIAITANALQGDRESCLAAGMDDYLSKPFTQQELGAVIGRWIALPLAATVHHDDQLPTLPPESREVIQRDVINCRALDQIRALSKDGGDALVQKVIATYVNDAAQQLQTLRNAIAGFDTDGLRKVAHSLKSSSANVGADTLAQLCKEMEYLGRAATTEGASGILTNMELEFQAVRHSLSAILEKES